jgi:hypothetical protein
VDVLEVVGGSTMGRKIKIAVLALIVVSVIATFAAYFMAKSSEPYRYLEEVAHGSPAVKEVVGDVKSIKLAPFGYSVRYSGPQGWAEFETEVIGTKGSGTLFVKLESNLGAWQVTGARLNGNEIKL